MLQENVRLLLNAFHLFTHKFLTRFTRLIYEKLFAFRLIVESVKIVSELDIYFSKECLKVCNKIVCFEDI